MFVHPGNTLPRDGRETEAFMLENQLLTVGHGGHYAMIMTIDEGKCRKQTIDCLRP